jgi:hypothetical protein
VLSFEIAGRPASNTSKVMAIANTAALKNNLFIRLE